ncbi:Tau-tubulin kinase 2 [Aphelenchoides fujianensis]|nr:Tau-tubulin kinase 2 [Aphelenchoides fujianensis]
MPSELETDDGTNMKPGTVVSSARYSFVIVKLLGEGGFGAVYKVYEQSEPTKFYAMKVEKKVERRKDFKLKMEVAILKLVSQERTVETSHFTAIIDRYKRAKYSFVVMTLVGKSLDDLKRQRPSRVFSIQTGLGAGIQCLEAIQDLHKHGFIHRDVKPANYAVGLGNRKRIVYLLDFGIARRINNDENMLKAPRVQVAFKGTVRFASLNCHRSVELGARDDCESWFYLLLDLTVSQGLPWRKCSEKIDVQRVKEEYRRLEFRDRLFQGVYCRDQYSKILDYIDALDYPDRPDYSYIYQCLREGAAVCDVNLNDPYDWEEESQQKRSSATKRKSVHTARFK